MSALVEDLPVRSEEQWTHGFADARRNIPPPPRISYALVQATVGVGTVLIWYLIFIWYQMYCSHIRHGFHEFASRVESWTHLL